MLLACKVAKQVQQSLVSDETITKKDSSPVTVGDYSVQALVIHMLSTAFPGMERGDKERGQTNL